MVAALNRFMERLSSSNETLRAFMAEAAHQMRTPLAALRAQAQLALDDDDPEDMRRSLQAIERNATHMSRLLNQLLSDASVIHRSHLQRLQRWTWPRPCTRPCMRRCRRQGRHRAYNWR